MPVVLFPSWIDSGDGGESVPPQTLAFGFKQLNVIVNTLEERHLPFRHIEILLFRGSMCPDTNSIFEPDHMLVFLVVVCLLEFPHP